MILSAVAIFCLISKFINSKFSINMREHFFVINLPKYQEFLNSWCQKKNAGKKSKNLCFSLLCFWQFHFFNLLQYFCATHSCWQNLNEMEWLACAPDFHSVYCTHYAFIFVCSVNTDIYVFFRYGTQIFVSIFNMKWWKRA